MKRLIAFLAFSLIFSLTAFAQTATTPQPGGVIFKIPDDVFPMDWQKSGFKGILMLRKESPSGIFICYPNEGEEIAALKERTVKFIAPMFVGDEEEKKGIDFQKSPVPNHPGDAGETGTYYLYTSEKNTVQILLYDRIANGNSLIYGYFAMKNKTAKPGSVKDIWADDKGQGIKIFEKFRKTLKD
jgi:hypothetical protein